MIHGTWMAIAKASKRLEDFDRIKISFAPGLVRSQRHRSASKTSTGAWDGSRGARRRIAKASKRLEDFDGQRDVEDEGLPVIAKASRGLKHLDRRSGVTA